MSKGVAARVDPVEGDSGPGPQVKPIAAQPPRCAGAPGGGGSPPAAQPLPQRPEPTKQRDALAEARRQWEARGLAEPAAMAATTAVMRAQQLVSQAVERVLRPLGLSFARYEALMLLSFSRTGSLPLSKVGERLLVHPTSVTNTVDKLEQQGLVRRERHPSDRRTTLATITAEGRALAQRATTVMGEVRFGMPLDDDAAEALVALLTRLRAAAGDAPDEGALRSVASGEIASQEVR